MSETTPEVNGPDAPPRDGHWVKLGQVGVDTGLLAVCDPSYVEPTYQPPTAMFDEQELSYPYGQPPYGVQFSAGFGDGVYNVWGWIVDGGLFGERIAQVVITMIVPGTATDVALKLFDEAATEATGR